MLLLLVYKNSQFKYSVASSNLISGSFRGVCIFHGLYWSLNSMNTGDYAFTMTL